MIMPWQWYWEHQFTKKYGKLDQASLKCIRKLNLLKIQQKWYWPRPCLWVDMGGSCVQVLVAGSYASTVLRVLSPSRPPTTCSLLSSTATPNWRRRPVMVPILVQLFVLRSYFSMPVEPVVPKKLAHDFYDSFHPAHMFTEIILTLTAEQVIYIQNNESIRLLHIHIDAWVHRFCLYKANVHIFLISYSKLTFNYSEANTQSTYDQNQHSWPLILQTSISYIEDFLDKTASNHNSTAKLFSRCWS